MHGIVEQRVIQHSVRSDCVEQRLTIDEGATMRSSQVAVDSLKRDRAAHRHPVQVSSGDVVLVCLRPVAGSFQQASQAVMRLGKPGLGSQENAIQLDGALGVGELHSARDPEVTRKCFALGTRGLRRQERAERFEAGVVGRWNVQDWQSTDLLGIRRDRLQAAAEIGQYGAVLRRIEGWHVDQLRLESRRRNDFNAKPVRPILDKADKRRHPARELVDGLWGRGRIVRIVNSESALASANSVGSKGSLAGVAGADLTGARHAAAIASAKARLIRHALQRRTPRATIGRLVPLRRDRQQTAPNAAAPKSEPASTTTYRISSATNMTMSAGRTGRELHHTGTKGAANRAAMAAPGIPIPSHARRPSRRQSHPRVAMYRLLSG
jgi:hypothetical protein